jgi:GNAT superfamily N-acetyltransferase
VAVAAPSERVSVVAGFTGHVLVAADVDQDFIDRRIQPWNLGAAFLPPFLSDLLVAVGARAESLDALLLAAPLPGPPPVALCRIQDNDHPRVQRARAARTDVQIYQATGGVLVLGRGVCGRREVGVEVDPPARGRGLGRALIRSARHLVDGPLWAQVAVGNVASLRAFLAAGFQPVGQETLLVR